MALPGWELATSDSAACTSCGSRNTVRVFPAMFRDAAAPVRPEGALDGEAVCFDHASKRAVAACHQCGRFVCQLCAVEFADQVWCPSCLASGSGRARVANPESRVLYDSITMLVPIVTLLVFWPITTLTAPGTLVFGAAKWRKPLSIVRRNRWRFVVGILLGLAETVGWLWFLLYSVTRWRSGT